MSCTHYRRSWAEIDLDNARHNLSVIADAANAPLCCVIKANGYGHGAVQLAQLYQSEGVAYLGVATLEEALELRYAAITLPILVLGYTPPQKASFLSRYRITQCIYSLEYANLLSSYSRFAETPITVHIKLDTGMNRLGFACTEAELDRAFDASQLPGIIAEGLFTHFSVADGGTQGEKFTRNQFALFLKACDYLDQRGVSIRYRHCANSAAILDYPDFHLDMVRAGIALYGLSPSKEIRNRMDLKPIMTLKSTIIHLHLLEEGASVGYGRAYRTNQRVRVATIPIGYGDGFWRSNGEGTLTVLIHGREAPLIGRVCMDQIMVDVTRISCQLWDEVIVFGSDPGFTIDDVAECNGTINYEIACAIGQRIPRIYRKNGCIVEG